MTSVGLFVLDISMELSANQVSLFDDRLTSEYREFIIDMGWQNMMETISGQLEVLSAFMALKEVRIRMLERDLAEAMESHCCGEEGGF